MFIEVSGWSNVMGNKAKYGIKIHPINLYSWVLSEKI